MSASNLVEILIKIRFGAGDIIENVKSLNAVFTPRAL